MLGSDPEPAHGSCESSPGDAVAVYPLVLEVESLLLPLLQFVDEGRNGEWCTCEFGPCQTEQELQGWGQGRFS